jgi:hypothetical protein
MAGDHGDGVLDLALAALRRLVRRKLEGGAPNIRTNARRMRSISPKPTWHATSCMDRSPLSIRPRAASTRKRSTALAGVTPVSAA